jgi:FkbM family methyltransferase
MPGDLFIDVGANVGSYSILAGDLGAHVIALEPAPDTFALLAENVQLNGYPVTMIQAAAGVNCGAARFTTGQDCINRLAANGPVEIEMVSLDSVIQDRVVAGMKVDVEGFEIDVLRGCERALSQQRLKLIQLEWNSSSIEAVGSDRAPIAELLANYGYGLYRPDMDGTLVPATDLGFGPDVFALPNLLKSGAVTGILRPHGADWNTRSRRRPRPPTESWVKRLCEAVLGNEILSGDTAWPNQ